VKIPGGIKTAFTDDIEEQLLAAIGPEPEGQLRPIIQRYLKWPGSTLTKRLKEAQKRNLIIILYSRKKPQLWRLTYKGRQRLVTLQNSRILGPRDCVNGDYVLVALQQYKIKYEIYSGDVEKISSTKTVEMNNWIQHISGWKKCVVIVNRASSVEIHVKQLIGHCEHSLENYARNIADTHMLMLCSKYNLQVGPGIKVGNPEFEIKSSIAREEIREYGVLPGVRDMSIFGSSNYADMVFNNAHEVTSWKFLPQLIDQMRRDMHLLVDRITAMELRDELWLSFFNKLLQEVRETGGEDDKSP
jgi:hypothetical protein